MGSTAITALQDLATEFKQLDVQKTGKVPYADVVKLLKSGLFDLSDVEVRNLMCRFDLDGDGFVEVSGGTFNAGCADGCLVVTCKP
jgi:Ca2+-binding EF-hand superfamily protein